MKTLRPALIGILLSFFVLHLDGEIQASPPPPLAASAATAPAKKPGEAVALKNVSFKGELKPGGNVTAVLQFKIDEGYHVQANPASEPTYIPATLTLTPAEGVLTFPAQYPAGKEERQAGLEKPLLVYEGTFEILLPIKLSPDAKIPLTISGVLGYQACKGSVCYPPRKLKVSIDMK